MPWTRGSAQMRFQGAHKGAQNPHPPSLTPHPHPHPHPHPQPHRALDEKQATSANKTRLRVKGRKMHRVLKGFSTATWLTLLTFPVEHVPTVMQPLLEAVLEGFKDSKINIKHSASWSAAWRHPILRKKLKAAGYSTYGLVQAPLLWREQFLNTILLERETYGLYFCVLPGLEFLCHWCLDYLGGCGRRVEQIHFLRQDSKQARFSIHNDLLADIEVTFVFQLSPTRSSMQVIGAQAEQVYEGQGAGVAFWSGLYHRSGWATDGTMKVAIFVSSQLGIQRTGTAPRSVYHGDVEAELAGLSGLALDEE